MFYSTQILARKGPLGLVWIAAHMDRGLKRSQVYEASIPGTVDVLLSPEAPLALRLSGQLLLGVCRIYSHKVTFLFQDCQNALVKIRLARPEQLAALTKAVAGAKGRRRGGGGAADADAPVHTLPLESITLPDDLDELQLLAGDNFNLQPLQPGTALEAMLEEMQQGGRPGGARRRRASMGISLAVSSETGFQEGCSLGLLFAPSTHFTGGGVGDSGDVEMEVFEDAGAPFQFDLEEVEIERLRAVPASEASGGAADLAALLGGELSAGGRTRGGASIVGDDEDTRSGSPSSGLTVAASRERESGGVDRRRSTATAATMAAGGRGAVKTSEPLLGELLPDLSLGAGAGDLDLAMDLGISDEQVEGDDGGGATTPSKAPGVSGTRQRAAVSAGDAATGAGAADAATASALHTGTAAVAAVSRGVSFTAEDIRATMEAADRAAASMDPYDVLPDADVNVVGHEGAAPADSRLSGPSQDDDVAPQDRLPRRDGTEQAEQRAATPPPVYHDHDGIDAMEVDVDGGGAAAAPPTGGAMHAARTVSGAASLHVNVGAVQRSASQRTMGNVEAEAGLGVDAGNSQARDAAGVHSLGPAPSASYGATGGPPSSAGGQAAGSNSALRTGGSIMSTGAAMIGGSGGGGGGGSAATASIDGGAGATVPNEEEQAPAAVPVAPLPRMLTRRAAAAVAAAEATAAAALPIEPAATAAAAKANAAEDQGALEDQQSSPPQERAPMGRRRGARVVAGRSITLDEEGLTLKTAHLREWIQDRSGILDQTRLMKLSSSTGAEPAAHHPRHHQQTAKRRRVATDGSFVALMHARAESDMEGVMRSGQEVLNSAEPAAVGSWQPLMQDPAPAVRSDVGRRLPRQRSVRAAAPLAPSIQALFRVAVGQMAPQYALQMGAAAAAGPMGRARAPSGAGGGAPSDAGGAAVCPAPSWRMTPAGLAGAGTPTRGVGTTAGVPAPSANTMGVGGTGVNVTRGTPSTQRHGVSPAQGLVGNASAGAAMPMQVFSGATAGGSRGGVTASGALPGGSLGRRSDGDVRGMEGGDDDVGQGVEEQARAGTPVERLGSALGGAAARTSAGGASRQGLALRDEGPAGSGRQLRVVLFPARDEEDEAAQMMEDVRERENEDANLADGLQMGLAHASAAVAAAAAAAATSEVSLGHTESDKENNPVDLNEDAGKEDLPPRQGTVGTSAHRQPLGLQQQTQQYLSTPSRATGGITPAASAGRMQGPGGRASAAAGAASGASAAAAEEGPWGPRQEGVWGLDPGYGGGAVAEAMDVDGEGRNAALEAEQGLAGGVDMNLGAADLAHGQIRSRGSQRTSAASAPSAQQAAEGSGGANAADAGAQRPVPQLATPLGSRRKVPGSAMRLRSQTRSQPSALQGGQQHDAGGPVAGTPLGVGTGGAGDESMSHSEGLGLGSMLQRRQRPRFIDDDGVDSGGGEAGAGGSGGGYSGYSPGALSAGRTASQHGTGSQGRLCRSNLHSIQEEVQEGGTPVHLAAAGPGSGAAQPVSDGRLTNIDPRTTGALRTALATGSGLMSDADWSREQDESLATRTLQEFDLVARAAAVAAVAAAGIGSAQPGLVTEAAGTSQQPYNEGGVSEVDVLPLGLDLLRRPFGCASSRQSQRQLSQPVARKLHELETAGEGAAAEAGTQHPTQLRSDGDSDGVDMGAQQRAHQTSTQGPGGNVPLTQWRPIGANLGGSQGDRPPWSQALLFRGAADGGAGGNQATGCAAGAVQLSVMTRDKRRKDAARCFYDMLVLNNRGLVDLQQEAPARASRHVTGAPAGATTEGPAADAGEGAESGAASGLNVETEAGNVADNDDDVVPVVWVTLTQAGVEAASQRLLQRPAP